MSEAVAIEPGVVVRWVGWAVIESMTLIVLSFVTLLVTARLLGPANFGVAASVIAIIGILNTAVEGLFSEALVQRTTVDDGHVGAATWTALGVGIALVALCLAGGGALAAFYSEPRMGPLLQVASFGLLFSGFSGIQSALLRRAFQFRRLAMRTLLARVTSCVVTLIMAVAGYGPWSLIVQYLLATILGAVALFYWSPRPIVWHYRQGALRDLWRFAGPWLANEIVQVNLPRLYLTVAAYLYGSFQFGLLGMGFRLTETMRELIGSIANNVGLPVFARLQDSPHRLARHYAAATSTLCLIALPIFAGLAICAPTIVEVVLGKAWMPSVPLIQMLALGAGIGFTTSMSYTMFAALGRPALTLPLSLFEGVLSVALLFSFFHFGIMAASFAWTVRQIVSAVLLQILCLRVLPLTLADMFRALWQPLLLVLAFSAALYTGSAWTPDTDPILRFVLLVMEAGVIFLIGLAIFRPSLVSAAIAQFAVMFKRSYLPARAVRFSNPILPEGER